MENTPTRRATVLNRHGKGAGRIVTGVGLATMTDAQKRHRDRMKPAPEGRVTCHACFRHVMLKADGTLKAHNYCLAAGTRPEPIT